MSVQNAVCTNLGIVNLSSYIYYIDDIHDVEVCEEEEIEEDLEFLELEEQAGIDPHLLWLVHFLALLQKKHFIPDAALILLLRFLTIFFKILSRISPQLVTLSQQFPPTLYKFHKLLGTRQKSFTRYVVCPNCSLVYKYEDCLEKVGTSLVPKLCKHRTPVMAYC